MDVSFQYDVMLLFRCILGLYRMTRVSIDTAQCADTKVMTVAVRSLFEYWRLLLACSLTLHLVLVSDNLLAAI